MPAKVHKECYGTMFPDAFVYTENTPTKGKAFSFELDRAGGTFRSGRKVSVDREEWDDCVQCPEFNDCYRLCIGRLILEGVVINE